MVQSERQLAMLHPSRGSGGGGGASRLLRPRHTLRARRPSLGRAATSSAAGPARASRAPPHAAFYVVNLAHVVRQHERWLKEMPRVTPYYAVKCNGDRKVLDTLASLGCGFDCAR